MQANLLHMVTAVDIATSCLTKKAAFLTLHWSFWQSNLVRIKPCIWQKCLFMLKTKHYEYNQYWIVKRAMALSKGSLVPSFGQVLLVFLFHLEIHFKCIDATLIANRFQGITNEFKQSASINLPYSQDKMLPRFGIVSTCGVTQLCSFKGRHLRVLYSQVVSTYCNLSVLHQVRTC